jgi:RNA polymerase sigma-70 factor (ECF subfamily)
MDEIALIQSAQDGDLDAFQQLFDENKHKIYAAAYKYLRNKEDAEDILQETFIKAYQSLEKFRTNEDTNFTSWLLRISINSSIDFIRKNRKMRENHFDSDNIDKISSTHESFDPEHARRLQDVREKIDHVLNSLTVKQRMIFILRHYQQLSTQEIAEYMNCSQGSIKRQLFRAVSAMKEHFKTLIPEGSYEMQKI